MNKARASFVLVLIAAVSLVISGCGMGAGRTMVIKHRFGSFEKANAIQVNEVKSAVADIPKSALDHIRDILVKKLEQSGGFDMVSKEKGGVILDVKIVSFDAGDQFNRWFWGGLSTEGEGKIAMETTYTDAGTGSEIAKIKTEGTITAGFFGGSVDTAYANAVKEIVDYTIRSFGSGR